jgi:hypothetical protein
MNKHSVMRALVVAVVAATIVINGLANALPLNDLTTGEISDRFEVYFVPAGYVFSIWGVIYLGLIAFAIYQALPAQANNPRLQRIRTPFLITSLANIAWLFLWHYERFGATIVAMAALLVSLAVIYVRLEIGRSRVDRVEKYMVRVPFSIYLGWVSVATIANATSLLDYLGWGGWGLDPQVWAAIMIGVTTLLGIIMAVDRYDGAFILVLSWALVGIAVEQSGASLVVVSAWVAVVVLNVVIGVVHAPRLLSNLKNPGAQS